MSLINSRLNCPKSTWSCRRVLGRLFQTGPATQKLLSPNRVLVLGTTQMLAEQRRQITFKLCLYYRIRTT